MDKVIIKCKQATHKGGCSNECQWQKNRCCAYCPRLHKCSERYICTLVMNIPLYEYLHDAEKIEVEHG